MSSRPGMSGSQAQSLDLDPDVCAVKSCTRGTELYAYAIPICDWHWAIACNKRVKDNMPAVLRDMLPRRDRYHIKTT